MSQVALECHVIASSYWAMRRRLRAAWEYTLDTRPTPPHSPQTPRRHGERGLDLSSESGVLICSPCLQGQGQSGLGGRDARKDAGKKVMHPGSGTHLASSEAQGLPLACPALRCSLHPPSGSRLSRQTSASARRRRDRMRARASRPCSPPPDASSRCSRWSASRTICCWKKVRAHTLVGE